MRDSLGLQPRIEELHDRKFGLLGIRPLEALPRAFENHEIGRHRCGLQAFDEPLRLLEGDPPPSRGMVRLSRSDSPPGAAYSMPSR